MPKSSVELNILLADGGRIASQVVQAPVAAVLDSLKMDKNGSPGGGNTAGQYTLSAFWKDVPGMENYYRLKIYRNRIFQSETYILSDDRLGDGALIVRPVIRQSYDLGDTLRCELLSVNKAYFDYFTDIASASGQGLSNPSPYNPKGNLQGDALGYFGIWFVSEKTIIVR
ncbi:MAG: DUF4249 family protein [Saprospiraceae bacterium]|nr:DUF4249 family protein [Saprospiraceae bacterium]